MADWTAGLPQAQPMNIGGLMDLAQKAYQLQAAPYQVQQQQTQAAETQRSTGMNYLGTVAGAFAPLATKEKPTDEEAANMFLTLGRQFMPAGAPPNAQAAAALSDLHREYDTLPKGNTDAAYKARRQWFADLGARYGGPGGNVPSVPVYDQQRNAVIQVPQSVIQRNAAAGGSTGPGGPTTIPGGLQSAPGPAQEESGKAYIKARDDITQYPQTITPQYEAYRAVQALESTGKTFGPGVSERAKLQTAIQALAPDLAKKMHLDPNVATSVNEFDKWSNNIALSVPGGRQNQDTFLAAVNGQPNSHMDNATIKSMLATNIGLTNMWQVAQREAMKRGQGNFSDNAQGEMNNLDRRASYNWGASHGMPTKCLHDIQTCLPSLREFITLNLKCIVISESTPPHDACHQWRGNHGLIDRYEPE